MPHISGKQNVEIFITDGQETGIVLDYIRNMFELNESYDYIENGILMSNLIHHSLSGHEYNEQKKVIKETKKDKLFFEIIELIKKEKNV